MNKRTIFIQNEMEMKHCIICDETKPISEMYSRILNDVTKYSIGCKDCYNDKVRYKREIKKLINEGVLQPGEQIPVSKQYCHKCNLFQHITDFRITKIRGKRRLDTQCKTCIAVKDKAKYQTILETWELNPEKKIEAHKKQYQSILKRIELNPGFALTVRYRDRFKDCMRSGREWKSHLGCSIIFLKTWFEYQFRILKTCSCIDLNWGNKKTWHIDHVIPCNVFDFTYDEQVKICFHWSNLAPMLALDNHSKGDKIFPHLIKRQMFLAHTYKTITDNNDKTVAIAEICDETGALTTAANGKLLVQQME
jgi:hypothetical protein